MQKGCFLLLTKYLKIISVVYDYVNVAVIIRVIVIVGSVMSEATQGSKLRCRSS